MIGVEAAHGASLQASSASLLLVVNRQPRVSDPSGKGSWPPFGCCLARMWLHSSGKLSVDTNVKVLETIYCPAGDRRMLQGCTATD